MELITALFATGFLYQISLTQGQKADWDKCNSNAMVFSMSACQASRHRLSLASQTNDTAKLCRALQMYSDCMGPRLDGCKGAARMAYDVIRTRYANHYNCHVYQSSTNHFHSDSPPFIDTNQNHDSALSIKLNHMDSINRNNSSNSVNGDNNSTRTTFSTVTHISPMNTSDSSTNTKTNTTDTAPSTTHQLKVSYIGNDTDQQMTSQNQTTTARVPAFDPTDNGAIPLTFSTYSIFMLVMLVVALFLKPM